MKLFKQLLCIFSLIVFFCPPAVANSGFGINVGVGVPFLSQFGAHYFFSDKMSVSAGYNLLDIDVGEAGAKLSMPEVMFNYHPFAGSFFVGLGLGQESLEVTATESISSTKIAIEVDATTTIAKLGWMWGAANDGFWWGLDAAFVSPSGADPTITAPGVPTTDPNYIDAVEAAEDFGETAYYNVTFARLGYLF